MPPGAKEPATLLVAERAAGERTFVVAVAVLSPGSVSPVTAVIDAVFERTVPSGVAAVTAPMRVKTALPTGNEASEQETVPFVQAASIMQLPPAAVASEVNVVPAGIVWPVRLLAVPSAVAMSNVPPPAEALCERLTVNVNVVVPAFPSFKETSLIMRFGSVERPCGVTERSSTETPWSFPASFVSYQRIHISWPAATGVAKVIVAGFSIRFAAAP